MLTLADVLDLLADELARLSRRRFPLTLCLLRAFYGTSFRHQLTFR
jgi:hypothetical protein